MPAQASAAVRAWPMVPPRCSWSGPASPTGLLGSPSGIRSPPPPPPVPDGTVRSSSSRPSGSCCVSPLSQTPPEPSARCRCSFQKEGECAWTAAWGPLTGTGPSPRENRRRRGAQLRAASAANARSAGARGSHRVCFQARPAPRCPAHTPPRACSPGGPECPGDAAAGRTARPSGCGVCPCLSLRRACRRGVPSSCGRWAACLGVDAAGGREAGVWSCACRSLAQVSTRRVGGRGYASRGRAARGVLGTADQTGRGSTQNKEQRQAHPGDEEVFSWNCDLPLSKLFQGSPNGLEQSFLSSSSESRRASRIPAPGDPRGFSEEGPSRTAPAERGWGIRPWGSSDPVARGHFPALQFESQETT